MSSLRKKKIAVVGAGISGLTAGAYLVRSGHELLILEKTSGLGGLVGSFSRDGFLFDTGPRAIGDAGILSSMLADLNINIPLVKGEVSTGIEKHIVDYDSHSNVEDFITSLQKLFPENLDEIKAIGRHVRLNTKMAGTLSKVANPFFKSILKDWRYLFKDFIPWLPSFLSVLLRTILFRKSIEEVLDSISSNQSLKDMVSQHFFKGTPANFAFGYFENFQDYKYPMGGTGELPHSISHWILEKGGVIKKNKEIIKINPSEQILTDQYGEEYRYDLLLWTADLQTLYDQIDCAECTSKIQRSIRKEQRRYLSAKPGESAFSIFLALNENPEVFQEVSRGHFIYTPRLNGLGSIHRMQLDRLKEDFAKTDKQELFLWLKKFCSYNSYEISIPVLKDKSLAPKNKTGLIISLLCDGELFDLVEKAGWYAEFKEKTEEYMLSTLENSIYPGLSEKILFKTSATPITVRDMFGTSNGAITGWSLEKKPPVPHSLTTIMASVKTAIPHVYKAGQWSYSPAGVPTSIFTGRLAARAMQREARGSEKQLQEKKQHETEINQSRNQNT